MSGAYKFLLVYWDHPLHFRTTGYSCSLAIATTQQDPQPILQHFQSILTYLYYLRFLEHVFTPSKCLTLIFYA